MIYSMLLCGDRSDILYIVFISYRPYSRRTFNIPPRTLQGPRGHRTAAGQHPRIALRTYCIYLRKSAKIIARWPGGIRSGPFRYATHLVLNVLFTGCLFNENARRIGSRLFDTPAPVWWLKLTRRP